ncbi:MAG: archaemetzincin family Zn-dependent metalloprotease [Methanosarcinales archaeon]|nr:MAG: archaemetzincin family Zn-dependent metalloprotease [Methanosarcinales archaeon]
MHIGVIPVGRIDTKILKCVCDALHEVFGISAEIKDAQPIPDGAYIEERGQYLAFAFVSVASVGECDKNIVITDVDVYSPELNFVFGQAELGGNGCMISIHRLQSNESNLLEERAKKEAVHEIGHTLGLSHCQDKKCVMSYSPSINDVDYKGRTLCPRCERICSC